jgi:RNA polymerase sigma-70 factor (ECF subfamily)
MDRPPNHLATQPSDSDLLRLTLAGDETAFQVLYQKLKTGIFRYTFYMTNSQSAAEEVTQEVFLALLQQGHKYRAELGDVAAFAFGIARNFVRRIERRERAYEPLSRDRAADSIADSLTTDPDALPGELIRNQTVERVQAAVASLPDHYRQVVVLCDLCELSYADAASRLQCATGTIRSRLNRGHKLLAHKLKLLRDPQPEIDTAGTEGCVI